MTPPILKKFRREIKEHNIKPHSTLTLTDDPKRESNVLAATLLLKEVFEDRLTIHTGSEGMICGSREEQAALKLQEYTEDAEKNTDMLLSTLTKAEIETYLKDRTGTDHRIYIPQSAEVSFIDRVAEEYPDVRYGL